MPFSVTIIGAAVAVSAKFPRLFEVEMMFQKFQQKGMAKAVAAVSAKPGCLMLNRSDVCRLNGILAQLQQVGGGRKDGEEHRALRRKAR